MEVTPEFGKKLREAGRHASRRDEANHDRAFWILLTAFGEDFLDNHPAMGIEEVIAVCCGDAVESDQTQAFNLVVEAIKLYLRVSGMPDDPSRV